MPIQLHPDCKARLTAILAEGIPGIQTSHGKFLERLSVMLAIHKAERVIPDKGPVHEQLASYIGEFPIIEFVSDTLSLELTELDNYRADNPSAKLVEIKGYEDPRAVAERLVNQLEALPYRYTITAKLPEQLSALLEKFVTTYELSPTIRLSRHSAQFDTLYPLKSENERRQKRIHARSSWLSMLVIRRGTGMQFTFRSRRTDL